LDEETKGSRSETSILTSIIIKRRKTPGVITEMRKSNMYLEWTTLTKEINNTHYRK
jgi:hypothetical protein